MTLLSQANREKKIDKKKTKTKSIKHFHIKEK